ncbi:MAG: ATP-binding protein [Actinomycetota bacterium]
MTGTGFERRFPARPETLSEIRAAVAWTARQLGCCEVTTHDVVLAVDEACQNIIRHAYCGGDGDIVLQLTKDGGHLVVRLIDFAPPVDAGRVRGRPLDEVRPGGLGVHLIRSVMDEVAFLTPPDGAGNLLQMTKRIGTP